MVRKLQRRILPAGMTLIAGVLLLAACSTTSATTTGMPHAPMAGSHTPGVGMANGGMMRIGRDSVPVMLTDFAVTPMVTTVRAGAVTFGIMNRGATTHEFVVLRTDAPPGSLAVTNGTAAEAGHVGEAKDIAPGSVRWLTLTLSPGRYVLICNLSGHYELGMHARLTATD